VEKHRSWSSRVQMHDEKLGTFLIRQVAENKDMMAGEESNAPILRTGNGSPCIVDIGN